MAVRASKADANAPPPNNTFPVFPSTNSITTIIPNANNNSGAIQGNSSTILNQPLRRKYVDVFSNSNLDV